MTLGPDPARARAAVESLTALRDGVRAAEDDVLACLVVTGEPRPQRVLDDWLDQAADTLRALGETAADLSPTLDRYTRPPGTDAVWSRAPAASPAAPAASPAPPAASPAAPAASPAAPAASPAAPAASPAAPAAEPERQGRP
ncbi:hypothetical protein GCM10023168_25870 [Fodinibacter luteus]|uniref:Uncharacterized protein n=1 Tax=Fodinibacter luteus TaxID=552064 RepID=A0ABP8KJZ6_9MICO